MNDAFISVACPSCSGQGYVSVQPYYPLAMCTACRGTGRVPVPGNAITGAPQVDFTKAYLVFAARAVLARASRWSEVEPEMARELEALRFACDAAEGRT